MIIIGINAFHGDSSAAIIKDGVLVAAVEEERFLRIKHWAGFPVKSIEYCLHVAGVKLDQVDAVAINQNSRSNQWRKIVYTLKNKPNIGLIIDRVKNKKSRNDVLTLLRSEFPDDDFQGTVQYIDHHMAHLSSAFHVSPFREAAAVSVDGFGDFSSGAWGVGTDTKIDILDSVYFPHSLGIFYQALTQHLGFPHYGDEYKVMGLAPYGVAKMMREMRQILKLHDNGHYSLSLKYFKHHKEKIASIWLDGVPEYGNLFSDELIRLLGPVREKSEVLTQRHFDLARSIQTMYEEAFFHLLNVLHEKTKLKNLALAGGCGMNSVANGKIYRSTPFKKVYIQSAAGDAGGAIGAAYSAWFKLNKQKERIYVMDHAYFGPAYSNDYIDNLLKDKKNELSADNCSFEFMSNDNELFDRTAKEISEGQVVGWFQGRMEWGPRALGNRSILCDPRRGDMKEILNTKIKRRESFRPFAPSILREDVSEWFEEDDDVPFMMKVFQIKESRRKMVPAVSHIDGSGRLQTVLSRTNSRYYELIKAFRDITTVPILLNTSFNENEPIVCKPEEAMACFLRTKMDVLVMGNYFIRRPLPENS